jgi:hypothetical protein
MEKLLEELVEIEKRRLEIIQEIYIITKYDLDIDN